MKIIVPAAERGVAATHYCHWQLQNRLLRRLGTEQGYCSERGRSLSIAWHASARRLAACHVASRLLDHHQHTGQKRLHELVPLPYDECKAMHCNVMALAVPRAAEWRNPVPEQHHPDSPTNSRISDVANARLVTLV